MITALMNRAGDVFILLAIALILMEGGYNFNITSIHNSSLTSGLVVLVFFARMTNINALIYTDKTLNPSF